jgi:hypothetical protein
MPLVNRVTAFNFRSCSTLPAAASLMGFCSGVPIGKSIVTGFSASRWKPR